MPTPSIFPPFLFAVAGNSGGGPATVAGPVTVALQDVRVTASPQSAEITVTVFPSSIVAGG